MQLFHILISRVPVRAVVAKLVIKNLGDYDFPHIMFCMPILNSSTLPLQLKLGIRFGDVQLFIENCMVSFTPFTI